MSGRRNNRTCAKCGKVGAAMRSTGALVWCKSCVAEAKAAAKVAGVKGKTRSRKRKKPRVSIVLGGLPGLGKRR